MEWYSPEDTSIHWTGKQSVATTEATFISQNTSMMTQGSLVNKIRSAWMGRSSIAR